MSENQNNEKMKPIIFLAFAGNLPSLADEYNKIWTANHEAEGLAQRRMKMLQEFVRIGIMYPDV